MTKTLPLESIRIDGETQARVKIDDDVVADYAEIINQSGGDWPFPPVDVFCDGTDHYMADGFHRHLAAKRAGRESIPVTEHTGTAYDARIFGMTANDTHGLRMTRADKRACVEWLLNMPRHLLPGKMTQKEIAEKAGVSLWLVKDVVASRKPDSIRGKATPPKRDGEGSFNPHTPISGGSAPFEDDEPEDDWVEEEEGAEPEDTRQEEVAGQPPAKKYDQSFWYKQWDQAIGPVTRLVDKIAENVGETNGTHHKCVHDHLELAEEEMAEWMRVND